MPELIDFSIIVVTLNPGIGLTKTLESVLNQNYDSFEIIIKDGGSTDGAVEKWSDHEKIKLIFEKDSGIYDAMNQAVVYANGKYTLFINAGDTLYAPDTLKGIAEGIAQRPGASIYYGDVFEERKNLMITSPPDISRFTCYRTNICHQATIYQTDYIRSHNYDTVYRITADYNLLVNACINGEMIRYLHIPIASYMGGGFSETEENRKKSKKEREDIIKKNYSAMQRITYKLATELSGQRLRIWMSENKTLAPIYANIKKTVYRLIRSK